MAADPIPAAAPHVLLFDGVCGFCDRAVRWLIARDGAARLRFAPLQGPSAAALRARHPEIPEELETMVLVEAAAGGERVYRDSEAFFRVVALLDPPWHRLAALRVLPRVLTDFVYRQVVRTRYRLWGRLESCRVPGADERARFLD